LMRIWLENDPASGAVQQVHQRLLATLQSGDADRMEQEMRAHVRRTAAGITRAMRAGQPAS
ncbi:GntR family transcriptional regulator, partial [Acidovorax sp. CCYZU-2555]|nr:GntR family transcriptional regulator [Acidovorax sp. CCYZU-2555]